MNFKINVKGLLAGLQPAEIIATSHIVKDFPFAGHVGLDPTPDCLFVLANGGRVSIKNPVPFMTDFCTDYQFGTSGTVSVKVTELKAVIASFHEDEVLSVSMTDGEHGMNLILRPMSDESQEQTLPCLTDKINTVEPTKKFDKEIVMSRGVFVRSMSRVLFAGGFEEQRPRYLYWVLRSSPNRVRFVAGSGARFAALTVIGDGVCDVKESHDMILPVEPSHVINKVLNAASNDKVSIRQSTSGDRQYLVECGDLRFVITGFEPPVTWVNEDDILARNNAYMATVKVDDFSLIVKGAEATNNDDAKQAQKKQDKAHATTLTINKEKNIVQLNSGVTMKASRKTKASDILFTGEDQTVSFRCVTKYLAEAINHAQGSEYIQFELFDENRPLTMRFFASPKVTAPPLLTKITATGYDEEFVMFVARQNEAKQ